jgi:phage gp45-like
VNDLVSLLRAIVRDELARTRLPELGTVTQVFPKSSDDGPDNHQVNLKLRSSGVELQRVPVTVSRLGLSALPNEGDLMVVAFVGGDLNAPVALGCLYDDQSHPPKADLHEVVYQPPDDEQSGVRRFHFELKNGDTVTFDDDKLDIKLGDTEVIVNKDGDVSIKAKGKIELSADGDIEVSGQGDVKISAQGSLLLQGQSVAVEGQSDAKVKGPSVTLAGNTQFSPS